MTAAITAVLYAIHLRHSYPTRYLVHRKRTHRFSLLRRTQYLFLALNITHYSFSPHCIVLVIVVLAVSVFTPPSITPMRRTQIDGRLAVPDGPYSDT